MKIYCLVLPWFCFKCIYVCYGMWNLSAHGKIHGVDYKFKYEKYLVIPAMNSIQDLMLLIVFGLFLGLVMVISERLWRVDATWHRWLSWEIQLRTGPTFFYLNIYMCIQCSSYNYFNLFTASLWSLPASSYQWSLSVGCCNGSPHWPSPPPHHSWSPPFLVLSTNHKTTHTNEWLTHLSQPMSMSRICCFLASSPHLPPPPQSHLLVHTTQFKIKIKNHQKKKILELVY